MLHRWFSNCWGLEERGEKERDGLVCCCQKERITLHCWTPPLFTTAHTIWPAIVKVEKISKASISLEFWTPPLFYHCIPYHSFNMKIWRASNGLAYYQHIPEEMSLHTSSKMLLHTSAEMSLLHKNSFNSISKLVFLRSSIFSIGCGDWLII